MLFRSQKGKGKGTGTGKIPGPSQGRWAHTDRKEKERGPAQGRSRAPAKAGGPTPTERKRKGDRHREDPGLQPRQAGPHRQKGKGKGTGTGTILGPSQGWRAHTDRKEKERGPAQGRSWAPAKAGGPTPTERGPEGRLTINAAQSSRLCRCSRSWKVSSPVLRCGHFENHSRITCLSHILGPQASVRRGLSESSVPFGICAARGRAGGSILLPDGRTGRCDLVQIPFPECPAATSPRKTPSSSFLQPPRRLRSQASSAACLS